MNRRAKVRLVLVYAFCGLAVCLLQVLWPSRLTIDGIRPDLALVFTATIGYLYGNRDGAVVGLGCGFWLDMQSGRLLGLGMLLLLLAGMLPMSCSGVCSEDQRCSHPQPFFLLRCCFIFVSDRLLSAHIVDEPAVGNLSPSDCSGGEHRMDSAHGSASSPAVGRFSETDRSVPDPKNGIFHLMWRKE